MYLRVKVLHNRPLTLFSILDQECVPLDHLAHGSVHIHPINKFGAVAQYLCEDGFKLRGDKVRVCQGDQTWSGSQPTCVLDRTIGKLIQQTILE